MEMPKTQSGQNDLEREEQSWKTNMTRLEDLVQSYSCQDDGIWYTSKAYKHVTGTEQSLEVVVHICGQLVFNNVAKAIQNKQCQSNWIATYKKN